jgi:hypothetical protein
MHFLPCVRGKTGKGERKNIFLPLRAGEGEDGGICGGKE